MNIGYRVMLQGRCRGKGGEHSGVLVMPRKKSPFDHFFCGEGLFNFDSKVTTLYLFARSFTFVNDGG